MKKLKLIFTITPLLFLAGCGFQLNEDMLCNNGGIWKMKEGEESYIVIFKKDGTAEISNNNNVLESKHVSYIIAKNDEGYELTIDGETIEISKKDQEKNCIYGHVNKENVVFQKEDKSYLNNLKKSQEDAKQKEEEKRQQAQEKINNNRKEIFGKVLSTFKATGLNGEGTIDTEDINISNFNVENKDLGVENLKDLTFDIPNNGKLKNGEKITVIINENGTQLYEQKLTVSGLTEYAKKISEIKNLNDVKKKMDAFCNKKTHDEKILRKAYFYYPKEGKFSMIYESESVDEYTEGEVNFNGFVTKEGVPFTGKNVSFPDLDENNTELEDAPSVTPFLNVSEKEECNEAWDKFVVSIKKLGGEEFK